MGAYIFAGLMAVMVWSGTAQNATAQSHMSRGNFSSVIDDLPLMPGIREVGEGVTFSSPDGRIAGLTAEGLVTRTDVLAFYAATLPQLGWVRRGETRFEREDESLTLSFAGTDENLRVRFDLAPLTK